MKSFLKMNSLWAKVLLSLCILLSKEQAFAVNPDAKILMVVTSSDHIPEYPELGSVFGLFAPEPLQFYQQFKKKGYDISQFDVISPLGGRAPVYKNDTTQLSKLVPELWAKLKTTQKPGDIHPDDYTVIFFVGGVSCLNDFPENQELGNIAARIYEKGGIVSGVCDGVSGLLPIKLSSGEYLVKNKLINCNEFSEYDFLEKEAFIDRKAGATVDGRIVTAYAVQPVPVANAVLTLLEELTTSVDEIPDNATFTVYPNPATEQIHVSFGISTAGPVKIEMLDALGNIIATPFSGFKSEPVAQFPITLQGFSSGLYTIRLHINGHIRTKNFIINR